MSVARREAHGVFRVGRFHASTHIVAVGDVHELHGRDSYYRTVVKAEEVRERGSVHGGHFKLEARVLQRLGQRLVPIGRRQRFSIGT